MYCPYNGFRDMNCSDCAARMWVKDPTSVRYYMMVCAIAYSGGHVTIKKDEE